MSAMHRLGLLFVAVVSCTTSEARTRPSPGASASAPPRASSIAPSGEPARSVASPPVEAPLPPARDIYAWRPTATERLDERFRSPPLGFVRSAAPRGSFAAFLRSLPLLPEGSPVVDYRGERLYDRGHHPNIAAVVDLDIGERDLQQCADTVLRLHAEWRYGRGDRDLSYRSVSGQTLSYARYVRGERAKVEGRELVFPRAAAKAADRYPLFRSWLDEVFAWAGTASLERDAAKVGGIEEVHAGDFFVLSGSPIGHAVIVLDVAKDDEGRVALLLGQGFMPAQSFHVLRPAAHGSAWFVVERGAASLRTPFWRPFPMSALRRLEG